MQSHAVNPLFHGTINILTGHYREKRGYHILRPHGTEDYLFIYTVAGSGRFGYQASSGPAAIITQPGQAVLVRPGTFHDYGVAGQLQKWELLWAHFQPRAFWLDWLNWPAVAPEAPGLMRLALPDRRARDRARLRLAQMHRLATGSSARRDDLALNALEEVLLMFDSHNPLLAPAKLDPRVRQIMEYLCQHLHEHLTLTLLAQRASLSVSRLAHLFRQQTGLTPQRFLEIQRLDRAKQLLAFTPATIKEIAYIVGFQNPFYFTLRFKRYTQQSPRMYRRSVQKGG